MAKCKSVDGFGGRRVKNDDKSQRRVGKCSRELA